MIERLTDYRVVKRVVPWRVRIGEKFIYLAEKAGENVLGIWSYEPYEDGLRIHADLGKECRGSKAIYSAIRSFSWIFRNTEARAIYAGIPASNRPACQVASRAGMDYAWFDKNGEETVRWFILRRVNYG